MIMKKLVKLIKHFKNTKNFVDAYETCLLFKDSSKTSLVKPSDSFNKFIKVIVVILVSSYLNPIFLTKFKNLSVIVAFQLLENTPEIIYKWSILMNSLKRTSKEFHESNFKIYKMIIKKVVLIYTASYVKGSQIGKTEKERLRLQVLISSKENITIINNNYNSNKINNININNNINNTDNNNNIYYDSDD